MEKIVSDCFGVHFPVRNLVRATYSSETYFKSIFMSQECSLSRLLIPETRKLETDSMIPMSRPYWLVLRVGVQRYLETTFGHEIGRVHYKYLICLMLVRFMDDSEGRLEQESVNFLKTKLCRRLAKLDLEKASAPGR